jgi:hypothetical protein
MIEATAVLLIVLTVGYTLLVRKKDLPLTPPPSPTAHLEERRAAIYENLRDLQFEYRVGKLSDTDYQQTKLALQKELAVVLAEIQKIGGVPAKASPPPAPDPLVCRSCGARMPKPMKFCGECGKAMA